jgi:hypothetical protein
MTKRNTRRLVAPVLTRFRGLAAGGMAVAVGLLLAASSQATPIVTSELVGLSTGTLGSVGTAEGWSGSSGNYTVTNGSGSLDGTPLGLYPSAGDMVNIAYASSFNSLNTYNNFAPSGTFPPGNPINIYYSFLYRFNTLTNMSDTVSNKIVQVNRVGSSSGVHFDLHAITNTATGKIRIGVEMPTGTPAYSTNEVSPGQTFFVVVRQQIIAGANNNIIDMWINPPASSFGADEFSMPYPDASAFDGTDDSGSGSGPGRFYVIAGVNANFDELRIATNSWADVTPGISSCTSASFDSDPVDATVSEGISASFSVTSSSSSPAFQWQVSTNAGSTWQDVTDGAGGTASTYTTPPLNLGADQNKYRCIATVSCGGGSTATSAVATVTVNAATVTPPGMVLDDQFADLSRTNAPITTNNSVWYASAATSLSDGSTGNLIGTPAPGSSRLWIAYFTDDAGQPVHLAVGRSIKASLTFQANGIAASGGNSMRFGLFDYADGGTRVSADGFGSGSTGNGSNVRGYMYVQDWGTTFSTDTPQSLYVRSVLDDNNLMGSTGDYVSLGAGPSGATLSGTPSFVDDTPYTLEMTVTRTSENETTVSSTLTGGSLNQTTTVTDSTYAYPRFDAFAIRPNSAETTANTFTITDFKVEVADAAPAPVPLEVSYTDGNVTLTWSNPAFALQAATEVNGTYTNVVGAASGYTVPATEARTFYRLIWPAP